MRRALVTGVSGFVGTHLARHLERHGWQVIGLDFDRVPEGGVRCDIRDAAAVAEGVRVTRPDVIFHLAGIAFVPAAERDPLTAFGVNAGGTLHVLEAAREIRPRPRVVAVSSAEVYGLAPEGGEAMREDTPLRPKNFYGVTKGMAEELARHYASRGLEVVIARPFNHIGPGQGADFVTADFARQVARAERGAAEPAVRVGNLDALRDFTDVRDAAEGYRLLAERGRSGEAYNLASGRAVAIREVLSILLSHARRPVPVEDDPARLRPSDTPRILGSTEKARREVGWETRIPLEQSLLDVLEDWRLRIAAPISRGAGGGGAPEV